ncbi:hypothetical protein NLG97_g3767 [Lecanicillium saksenae]|uniref:Uncharacterized protein n=1 Tax=Lecanicillium saksenae TaxID=468837 RepID=A0ACC1R147_9HYPO|nr:hypothetical protein NLG97_g3767 [Lecanicillium saksenae]
MSGVQGSLGFNQTGGIRQKRWTPRVRSGCLTCRARKVKCDEARPVCRRCIKTRVECRGYAEPADHEPNQRPVLPKGDTSVRVRIGTGPRHSTGSLQQHSRRDSLYTTLDHPDWEYFDGIKYYFQIVKPARMPETGEVCDPPFHLPIFSKLKFLSQIVCDQISRASKARGRLMEPGEDLAFAGIWERYHRYLVDYIRFTNELVRSDDITNQALGLNGIMHLLVMDLYIKRSFWRAHLNGFMAYLLHRGGPRNMKEPTLSVLNCGLAMAISANTTSPVADQIEGFDNFTDEELRLALDYQVVGTIGCHVDLLITVINITRWRVSAAKGGDFHALQQAKMQTMLDETWHFDIAKWAEDKFPADQVADGLILAPISAAAVRLYGILVLPKTAIATWASCSAQARAIYPKLPVRGPNTYDNIRSAQLEELMRLLQQAAPEYGLRTALAWPLAVVGVAVASSMAEDQIFVAKMMQSISEHPSTLCTYRMVLEKMHSFWASGKTEWEDCFDEPVACIPAP